jgi:uncharacterized protein YkwD
VRHASILLLLSLLVAFSSVQYTNAEEIGITSSTSITEQNIETLAAPGTYRAHLPLVTGGSAPTSQNASTEAQEILSLTNAERAAAGCPAVTLNTKLSSAAQGHAGDMVQNDFFAHVGSDGATTGARMTRQGYVWRMAGENIAAGYTNADDVVAGWMSSSGHRANILNCGYREMGVGYLYEQNDGGSVRWRHYWVQVFGTPR